MTGPILLRGEYELGLCTERNKWLAAVIIEYTSKDMVEPFYSLITLHYYATREEAVTHTLEAIEGK